MFECIARLWLDMPLLIPVLEYHEPSHVITASMSLVDPSSTSTTCDKGKRMREKVNLHLHQSYMRKCAIHRI